MAADPGDTYRSVWRSLMTTAFTQGYLDAGGLRTRYVRAGPAGAPTVLMLHGTGGHWETFCATLPALAERFDCVAIDMVGCGFTDKPDQPLEIDDYVGHALAVLDRLAIEHVAIIGVSLGSWVACRIAHDHPDRVDALILNAPAGLLGASARSAESVQRRRTLGDDPSWENVRATLRPLFLDESSVVDDIVAVRQQVYREPGMTRLAARTVTLFDPEVRQRNLLGDQEWSEITAPALVIAHVDAPDDYLTTARRIVELMPKATLVEILGASHWPHFEQPERFNAAALEFLSR